MTEIFVFGSNLRGIHGAGSALHARKHFGARNGIGLGRTGNAYAIPTKDWHFRVLPVQVIAQHVKTFLEYASQHPGLTFRVVAIGCGLAGYKPHTIAPLFRGSPENVMLPEMFRVELEKSGDGRGH